MEKIISKVIWVQLDNLLYCQSPTGAFSRSMIVPVGSDSIIKALFFSVSKCMHYAPVNYTSTKLLTETIWACFQLDPWDQFSLRSGYEHNHFNKDPWYENVVCQMTTILSRHQCIPQSNIGTTWWIIHDAVWNSFELSAFVAIYGAKSPKGRLLHMGSGGNYCRVFTKSHFTDKD